MQPGMQHAMQPGMQYTGQPGMPSGMQYTGQPGMPCGMQYTGQPGMPSGMHYNGQAGMPSGMQYTAQPGMHAGMQYTGQPGMQPGIQNIGQPGMQPGMQYYGESGMQPDMPYNGQPGMQQVMEHGMQPGMHPVVQPGMQDGIVNGMQPGIQTGMQHGIQGWPQFGVQPGAAQVHRYDAPPAQPQLGYPPYGGSSPLPPQQNQHLAAPAGDGKFVDPEFPPVSSSIFHSKNPDQDHVQDILNGTQGGTAVVWRRVPDLLGQGAHHLFDNIHPNDLTQGILGDCWLLAGLAGLAEVPGRVEQLFQERQLSPSGMYHIYFYDMVNRHRCEVIIDDHIPCGLDGQPLFSKPNGNEAWVLLLEKAAAKWFGSYVSLQGASPMVPFLFLTDCGSCKTFTQKRMQMQGTFAYDPSNMEVFQCTLADPHDRNSLQMVPLGNTNEQQVFNELKEADDNNHVMACWTTKDPPQQAGFGASGEQIATDGIVKAHAYTLVCANYFHADGRTWRLVQLRNPWGAAPNAEWNGDLSDNWPGWHSFPELRQQLGIGNAALDGMFFMTWERFLERFSDVGIAEVHAGSTRFSRMENLAARGIRTRGIDSFDVQEVKRFRKRGPRVAYESAADRSFDQTWQPQHSQAMQTGPYRPPIPHFPAEQAPHRRSKICLCI